MPHATPPFSAFEGWSRHAQATLHGRFEAHQGERPMGRRILARLGIAAVVVALLAALVLSVG